MSILTPKRILIFIPWFRPAYKAGGPIRSIDTLTSHYNKDVSYFIVCGHKDIDGTVNSVVSFDSWIHFSSNTKVWYYSGNFISLPLKDIVVKTNPTHVMLVGMFSWTYNLYPLLRLRKLKLIWSVKGMLHPQALSQKVFKKRVLLNLLRKIKVLTNITFHATNDVESKYIKNTFGEIVRVRTALNIPHHYHCANPIEKKTGCLRLLSISLISPMKNHKLVLQSLMQCSEEVKYDIVGAVKDKSYWKECLGLIEKLPKNVTVNYHGEQTPENLQPYLTNTHLLVMPSKSENYGHAIVEALSMGRPVLTSLHTPWNDLKIHHAGINTNTEVHEIAEAIDFFLKMNQEEYNIYCKGARQYFEKFLNVEQILEQYDQLFD
jgi:glycosyltransferase involved in cell wall biosynthesis